jgi:hypothetical protein
VSSGYVAAALYPQLLKRVALQKGLGLIAKLKLPEVRADKKTKGMVPQKCGFPGNGMVIDPLCGLRPGLNAIFRAKTGQRSFFTR